MAFRKLFVANGVDFWFDTDASTASVATDRIDPTHLLTLSSGSLAAPAADPLFVNRCKTLKFTKTQWMDSNRAGSAFADYVDGSPGCTRVDVFAPTDLTTTQVFSAVGNGAVSSSAVLGALATSGSPLLQVTNDVAAGVVSNTAGAAVVVNTPTYLGYTLTAGTWVKYNQTTTQTGAPGALGATCALPLRIGSQWAGGVPCAMNWRGSFGFGRVLTAAEWSVFNAYMPFFAGFKP